MRRPWMVIGLVGGSLGILIVALAPNITILLVGWCIAQLLFNAPLAAVVAVLPDQVPIGQRGLISGILGVCMPIASVSATFLVKLFTGNQRSKFAASELFWKVERVTAQHVDVLKAERPDSLDVLWADRQAYLLQFRDKRGPYTDRGIRNLLAVLGRRGDVAH